MVNSAGIATALTVNPALGATVPFACGGPRLLHRLPLQSQGVPLVYATAISNAMFNYGAGYSIEGKAADLSGNELPNSPHWTGSIGAQYTWDFSGGWSATLRGDYHQGGQYARVHNTAYDKLKSWDNANVTLKIEKPEWGFRIDAYVKNLTNDTPITRRLHHRRQLGPVHQPDHAGASHLRRRPDQAVLGHRPISDPGEGGGAIRRPHSLRRSARNPPGPQPAGFPIGIGVLAD